MVKSSAMSDKKINLSLKDSYIDIKDVLNLLPDQGDEYDYVLLHCYAHIKNEEIYLEIDKDIYEHVVIYEGRNFMDAVTQYFFMLKRGCILAYEKGTYPDIRMNDFTDSFDDYDLFIREIEDLVKKTAPVFYIKSDSIHGEIHSDREEILQRFTSLSIKPE